MRKLLIVVPVHLSFFLSQSSLPAQEQGKPAQERPSQGRFVSTKENASSKPRSTYESLTEDQGPFKELSDRTEERNLLKKPQEKKADPQESTPTQKEGPLINFNNVSIAEVLKYASRLTGKNFLYDPAEVSFSITMISDSPATVEDVMAMLLQSLQIHGFSLIEDGNTYVVHTNPTVKGVASLFQGTGIEGPQITTQVFTLQNVDGDRCAAVVKTMASDSAIVELIGDSKIVVSDITENIRKIAEIITKLDTQASGLEVGQYVALNASPANLVSMCERIMEPLASSKPFVLVPHFTSNSVFIVSTPFLIERALSIMQTVDLNLATSGILSNQKFDEELAKKKQREALSTIPELSKEDIDNMTREELYKKLRELGLTQDQIDKLSDEEARAILYGNRRSLQIEESSSKRKAVAGSELPIGSVESTEFLIYKLQYRKSSDIQTALKAIADSLTGGSTSGAKEGSQRPPSIEVMQSDLVITLNSVQAVDDNNTIVFTGTKASLEKAKDLIRQIDMPARQVFIEALVIDTTLTNSLQFGVEWAGKIERTNFGAQIGFVRPPTALSPFAATFNAIQQTTPNPLVAPSSPAGFSTSAIGRKIKFLGKGFRSTGALISALSADKSTQIMLNPKITTEHNIPAELFVGQQTPIKGQSIANSTTSPNSTLVTTNYNTVETGITLKITPLISTGDTVTLIIEQIVSTVDALAVQIQGQNNAPPATINETRTTTRVHLPSDHFLVISGLISEEKDLTSNHIPCLGALPIIGSAFGFKQVDSGKRNLMIFIRPIILDTPENIDDITHRQEQVMKEKAKIQTGLYKECDDLLNILNL